MKSYSFGTTIAAESENAAQIARDEAVGGIKNARKSCDLPEGATMDTGDLVAKDLDQILGLYRELHDGISDMIESGRLNKSQIPEDYAWLVSTMASLAAADAGPVTDVRTMRMNAESA